MAALASDNFNRADTVGPDLGPNWTNVAVGGFAANGFQIVSNHAEPTTLGSDKLEFYSGAAWPSDHYSQAKVSVTGTTVDTGPGVTVRSVADATCYRVVVCQAASNNVKLARIITGSLTTLDTFTSTWADGDVLKLEIQGTRLRVFQNGVQLDVDVFDTAIAVGAAGISYSSTSTSASLDDWEGGVFSSAADDPPLRLMGASAGW